MLSRSRGRDSTNKTLKVVKKTGSVKPGVVRRIEGGLKISLAGDVKESLIEDDEVDMVPKVLFSTQF